LNYLRSNSRRAQSLFYRCRYLLTCVLVQISFTPGFYLLISGLIGLKCCILDSCMKRPTGGSLSFLQPILHTFYMSQSPKCAKATKQAETCLLASLFVFHINQAENIKYLNVCPNSWHKESKSKSGSTFSSLDLSCHCKMCINKGLIPLFWVYIQLMEPFTCSH